MREAQVDAEDRPVGQGDPGYLDRIEYVAVPPGRRLGVGHHAMPGPITHRPPFEALIHGFRRHLLEFDADRVLYV